MTRRIMIEPKWEKKAKQGIRKFHRSFINRNLELRFRQTQLRRNITLVRNIILVVAFIMPIILTSDHLSIKPEYWPIHLVTMRIVYSLLCLGLAFYVTRFRRFDHFERTATFFIVGFFVYLWGIILMARDDYALFALYDMIVIIGLHVTVVLPFFTTSVIAGLYTVAVLLVCVFMKDFSFHTLNMLFASYFAANLTGMVIGAQKHQLKRVDFVLRRQLRAQTLAMKTMAYRDPLTGAHNRRAFLDHYEDYEKAAIRARHMGTEVFVVGSDIDFFKRINDTFGHDVGDKVLKAFTILLKRFFRPTDGVFRFGGEEYIIVVLYCSREVAVRRFEEMMNVLRNKGLGVEEIDYPVTSSFGMTPLVPGESWETIAARADRGLYIAKENGRNQLVFVEPDDVSADESDLSSKNATAGT